MKQISALEKEQILKDRAGGMSWPKIGKKHKYQYHELRMQCDPEYVEDRKLQHSKFSDRRWSKEGIITGPPEPPLLHSDPLLDRLKMGYR